MNFENAEAQLRDLRVADHFCTSAKCKADKAALDIALSLIQRESLVEALLAKQFSHFFHPDVTSVDAVQAAAEAVRNFQTAEKKEYLYEQERR